MRLLLSAPLLALLVTGCAEAPFVETPFPVIRHDSALAVCHTSDAERAAIDEAAEEGCAKLGKTAVFRSQENLQCRISAPSRSHYECVAP
ncbi:hypothetical protein [Telmatospirillum sp. J64-1]|uniref:hypothetical protein n=1 Tax=Telmatospirillum sp. J64-1 TaxID=2502183 RepID=UPI00115D263C|nr:hypothetical protein [Telmatospirillum sp. J64-1]